MVELIKKWIQKKKIINICINIFFFEKQKDQLKQNNRQIKRQVGCLTTVKKMEISSISSNVWEILWVEENRTKIEWRRTNLRSILHLH